MANGEALPSDIPKEERQCPSCGDEMPVIDTDIRERLEFIPAKFLVHELHHLKRACGKCKETVTLAPPPSSDQDAASLTKGSRYGFGVTAQIILGKFCDHLPLYRMLRTMCSISKRLAAMGMSVETARRTS